jgi:hypothetical protein
MRNGLPSQEERHAKKGSRRKPTKEAREDEAVKNKASSFQPIINEAFSLEKKYKPEKI